MENPFSLLDERLTNIEILLLDLKNNTLPNLASVKATNTNSQPERLINKKEAAKLLGVSLSTIDNYRRKGILIPKKISGVRRYKYSEVLKAIDDLQKED